MTEIDFDNLFTPSGELVALSAKCIVLTCPTTLIAQILGPTVTWLGLAWAIFGLCYTLRFVLQYFGNIPVFQIPVLRFAFLITKPANQFFLGWLPCIGGLDLGTIFSYFLFDKIDVFLRRLIIIDPSGIIYNLNV